MSTTTTGGTAVERQRQRASRGIGRSAGGPANRLPAPPRQRRPALAAIAVLLIVGGALLAGLLAVRMDSRVPVLAVTQEIPAGARIEPQDLTEVQVASENLDLIDAALAGEVVGTYAKTKIYPGQLLNTYMLERTSPFEEGNAVVSVLLSPGLTPDAELDTGDEVMVIRTSTEAGGSGEAITEGLVVRKSRGSEDDLGGASAGSVSLLVPEEAAESVVDAAGNNRAGLALISKGNSLDDVDLEYQGD